MRKIVVFIILLLEVFPVFACKPYLEGMNAEPKDLVQSVSDIYLVELISKSPSKGAFARKDGFDYKMKVIQVLKGKNIKSLVMKEFDKPGSSVDNFENKFDCKNHGSFVMKARYLVFKNSNHKKSIERVKEKDDVWLNEVMDLIAKESKKSN